jgi:hypothetical protein
MAPYAAFSFYYTCARSILSHLFLTQIVRLVITKYQAVPLTVCCLQRATQNMQFWFCSTNIWVPPPTPEIWGTITTLIYTDDRLYFYQHFLTPDKSRRPPNSVVYIVLASVILAHWIYYQPSTCRQILVTSRVEHNNEQTFLLTHLLNFSTHLFWVQNGQHNNMPPHYIHSHQ